MVGGGCERLMMVVGGGGVVLWTFVATWPLVLV